MMSVYPLCRFKISKIDITKDKKASIVQNKPIKFLRRKHEGQPHYRSRNNEAQ